MIGSGKSGARSGLSSRVRRRVYRYIGIDGGAGATLLADLAGRNPYLQEVPVPRHADLLLIVEPISQKLVPAVITVARAIPYPVRVLIVGGTDTTSFTDVPLANLDALFPEAQRVSAFSCEQILQTVFDAHEWLDIHPPALSELEETIIQLPTARELATEPAVLSLGPLQAFTSGPLRLFLVCDGEQVLSTQVETGYASRGINHMLVQADWQQGLRLARQFDPLTPIAGQLVYVDALEHLQGWQPSIHVYRCRALALALERVQNTFWWLVRFARLLADSVLTQHSYQLARDLAALCSQLWQRPPEEWILPHHSAPGVRESKNTLAQLQRVLRSTAALQRYVERKRGLALRSRGIGILTVAQLKRSGIGQGPVYNASEHGRGDVQSRLVIRARDAVRDLQFAYDGIAELAAQPELDTDIQAVSWDIPIGETRTEVVGPRGTIELHLYHRERKEPDGPTQVVWKRPSVPLLMLLPELLAGQKLADAEVILASLDIAMVEVDG